MGVQKSRSYVEHVALRVRDMEWYLAFFQDVLGMDVREVAGDPERPDQIWVGGMQLTRADTQERSDPDTVAVWHVGIFTEHLEETLEKVYSYPEIRSMPQGRNWFLLPDGLGVELMQAAPGSVEQILQVDPRRSIL
ncbi:MAG: VOC family protein [Lachnospiraceae bacterium]|nr:VOC family protein [Lachnospiraceae bacterium]